MYVIIRHDGEIFGPFPAKDRAEKYAESFEGQTFVILPIIVPNCVTVKLNY